MTESQCSCRSLSLAQRTSVCGNLPGKSAVLQLILSVITKFYLCFECFIIRIYSFRKTQQRNYRCAEFTEFFTSKNAFAFPECIEQSYQCRSLSRKIVQVEQLESADARCFQSTFYFFFIKNGSQFSGSLQVLRSFVYQSFFLQVFFHCHEIQRHQSSRIFRNFRKIRIDRILSYFMGHQRHFHTVYRCTEIFIK